MVFLIKKESMVLFFLVLYSYFRNACLPPFFLLEGGGEGERIIILAYKRVLF